MQVILFAGDNAGGHSKDQVWYILENVTYLIPDTQVMLHVHDLIQLYKLTITFSNDSH